MKKLFVVTIISLLACSLGCAVLQSGENGTRENPDYPPDCSTVFIYFNSPKERAAAEETLAKEFYEIHKYPYPSLAIIIQSSDKKAPIGVSGLTGVVEKVAKRAASLPQKEGINIRPCPKGIDAIRLADVLLKNPKRPWQNTESVIMAAERILSFLMEQGLIRCCFSEAPRFIELEDEREFIFNNSSDCQHAYSIVSELVNKGKGIIIEENNYLYCAGSSAFVSSVAKTIENTGKDFAANRYAFFSLRMYKIDEMLSPEMQYLCKYTIEKSVELASDCRYETIGTGFISFYQLNSPDSKPKLANYIKRFIVPMARFDVATGVGNGWSAIKKAYEEEQIVVGSLNLYGSIAALGGEKDRDSIHLLFSKALIECKTWVDYGPYYVEALAEILNQEATWYLVVIAETMTASKRTRKASLDCLKKIDTPEAKKAVKKLAPVIYKLRDEDEDE